MSCDSRRKKLVKHLLGARATPEAVGELERGYKAACGPLTEKDRPREQLLKTMAMMQLCDRYGLPRPVHSSSGLPRTRTHRAYAYLFDELARRGAFSLPVPEDAPVVTATDVPIWSMVHEACGCRSLRVPPPEKSPDYPYFMMLKKGGGTGCEHRQTPVGYIGWCFDPGFRVVEAPPPRPLSGPIIGPVPPGIYAADVYRKLDAIRQIEDRVQRAKDVGDLAYVAPSENRQPLLCEMLFHLGAADADGVDDWKCIRELCNMADDLVEVGDVPNALFLVRSIQRTYRLNDGLTRLVCKLPAPDRGPYIDECLDRARSDYDGDLSRLNMIQTLVYTVQDGEQALKILATFEHPARQAEAFTVCAKHLPDTAIPDLLKAARTIGRPDRDWSSRAEALAALVPRLTGSERDGVVEEVLALVEKRGHHYTRQKALSVAAGAMSPAQRRRALTILDSFIANPEDVRNDSRYASARVAGYTALLPLLDSPDRERVRAEALRSAYALPVVGSYGMLMQPSALIELLPYLEQPERAAAIRTILTVVPTLRDDLDRSSTLQDVAPYLDADHRASARALAETITSDLNRQWAMNALAEPSSAEDGAIA
ncbi:MAG TPA: hypothetical protein VFZ66_27610 [Herpetosiphonaceae bacterium]